jgi:hypothetical protein
MELGADWIDVTLASKAADAFSMPKILGRGIRISDEPLDYYSPIEGGSTDTPSYIIPEIVIATVVAEQIRDQLCG